MPFQCLIFLVWFWGVWDLVFVLSFLLFCHWVIKTLFRSVCAGLCISRFISQVWFTRLYFFSRPCLSTLQYKYISSHLLFTSIFFFTSESR